MMSLAGGGSANTSTASLPAQLRQMQGVGYRSAVSNPPPPGVRDPVIVLEGILGVSIERGPREKEPVRMPALEDADGIDFGELGLEEFVLAAEEEGKKDREYSEQSVEECMAPLAPTSCSCKVGADRHPGR